MNPRVWWGVTSGRLAVWLLGLGLLVRLLAGPSGVLVARGLWGLAGLLAGLSLGALALHPVDRRAAWLVGGLGALGLLGVVLR